ncbi:glutamate--cysteine ligase [Parahaliea maris]|uniref:Glutamate--cysteine ligase n=1 Tax=Parahaliea maris TaxID=2716870 RepID=A0A5C9A3V8_9GAMM|nr:glutamate--cysteine ligase [Parahaliea maris]TXS95406.1 glutamate--cysteine ligase [Parahaliea maris]
MGSDIDRTDFDDGEFAAFGQRLEDNLRQLEETLAQPGFGAGNGSLGSELEMYLVDADGLPLHANQELHADANDPQLTLELNRYNLEYNLSPWPLDGQPFANTEREILDKLSGLRQLAKARGGQIVLTGILPTLRRTDFGPHCITDRKRYHALVKQLIRRRGHAFSVDINGPEPLRLRMADITLEGANTSFQVHYRVRQEDFADTFNAIQLVTPLVLAVSGNSPTLFGHCLWHETRVPLFKQSIDTRIRDRYGWNEPARVNYGHGWVRRGALELFVEAVRLYEPLLPVCADAREAEREPPPLSELRLHQSTVWSWNRPVYDPADGGHLRIEMRALPAGPTPLDMVANAALLIGLAEGMRSRIHTLLPGLPFYLAEHNFYRAAQYGLAAPLVWPETGSSGYREHRALTIVRELLPLAYRGLAELGIDNAEAEQYLGVIAQRLSRAQTGASWQLMRLARLRCELPPEEVNSALLKEFIGHSVSNRPVAEWPL